MPPAQHRPAARRAVPDAELRPLLHQEWRSLIDQQEPVVELFEQASPGQRLRAAHAADGHLRPQPRIGRPPRPDSSSGPSLVKASGPSCFDKFLNTLHHWQDGILNYFGRAYQRLRRRAQQQTQAAQRRCFGLDDPVELFRRLWLDIEGQRLWA